MYKNYKVNIISYKKNNSNEIIDDNNSDNSDYYDYYKDTLQILDDDKILLEFNDYHYKKYINIDNYLIIDVDAGHEYTENNIFINLDTLEYKFNLVNHNNKFYNIDFDDINNKINFYNSDDEEIKYDIKYFFDNMSKIFDTYEYESKIFDTKKDTLLIHIFRMFNLNVDDMSPIEINGLTYGMKCQKVKNFKKILRDNSMTIDKQLYEELLGHTDMRYNLIYDIDLTIKYLDNKENKQFRILLECKDKKPVQVLDKIIYYGVCDENAKINLITV
jgi:hypothetical protein